MKKICCFLLIPFSISAQHFTSSEVNKWAQQAKQVSIIRDNYGIPHVYGKTDADAVFGLLYAQCEDDFQRVELNYIEKLGRLSELNGEKDLYNDLLIRLIIDTVEAKQDYETAPPWLKNLCNAFSDGINYFLYTHKNIKPQLLNRFEPWFPLLWTDGSIGAISVADIGMDELKNFYGGTSIPITKKNVVMESPAGSNGFAFSPSITASHHAILYINPHVTFYFRPEVHMVSEEGLNAYGAVTWGQFFVYQGFNEHCGWMHTSSYTDVSDTYIEKVSEKNNELYYLYNNSEKKIVQKKIDIQYKNGNTISTTSFNTYYTGHGPVMAKRNGNWISVKSNNRDIKGLEQSWLRTKATSFVAYKKVMDMLANTSNNTVYADAEGNIAYWHGNFIPKRDTTYDWSKPVDGTTSATEWKGLHPVNESVHIYNPPNGWIENCNSTPYTVAGKYSPLKKNYPAYMATEGQNFRGVNALRILGNEKNYTIDKVIEKGYDTYLPAFEILIPALIKTYEQSNENLKSSLKSPVDVLKKWDYHCAENSVATTLAVYWGEKLLPAIFHTAVMKENENDFVEKTTTFAAKAKADELLKPLLTTISQLTDDFGKWEIPWGDINRFQRISGDINNHFDDDKASYPVSFAASTWGMLPSYASHAFPGTKKRYGVHGNSFICAVEFGEKVTAKSLLAGGESGNPNSTHFFDQGKMYSKGVFKNVLFYKEDVLKNVEENYHPGER